MSGPLGVRRVRAIARGHVQGVFFRKATQMHARKVGVTGWARNLPDGSVEVEAQGQAWRIERFLRHVRSGPGQSTVTTLDVSDIELHGTEDDFTTG